MDKYYTPSIEEFHVGFIFEELFQDKPTKMRVYTKEELKAFPFRWQQLILDTSHSISRITSKIKQNEVRVKYLDKEDIESLGFNINSVGDFTYKEELHIIAYTYKTNVELSYDYDSRVCYIGSSGQTAFYGIIKNKLEFKKLLKQLNINK